MALWEQIKNRHEQRKQNVASTNNDTSALYNMLTNDKVDAQSNVNEDWSGSLGNIAKAAKTFMGSGSTGSSSVPSMYQFDNLGSSASSGSVPTQYQFGNEGKSLFGGFNIGGSNAGANTLGTNTGTTNTGGLFGGSSGGSSGGGTPWALIGALAKGGYNKISGKDDKDYSDTEESVIYPLQGAAMGSSFGPWGALGGALYGLSYGFKDDTNKWVGIKEGSFWDKLRHPIGMGDGGGFIDLG